MKTIAFALLACAFAAPGCKKDDEKRSDPATAPGAGKSADPGADPKGEPRGEAPDPALVERGAYVAALAGCVLCHTPVGPEGPDFSRPFAGGFEMTEAFGTWRGPNITPDKKTGIGDWTDEQIITAIREGKRPDGDQMFPIMPYLFFNVISDDDARALVAFLRAQKPVENAVAGTTDLKMPKIPAPKPSGAAPPADDAVAQGKYIADIAHCAMCHTPFDMEKGMPDMSRLFAGGFEMEAPPAFGTGSIFSANLTPDEKTGIGAWTDEEIIRGFKTATSRDGRPLAFVMQMYVPAWSQMTDQDAANLVAYLRSIDPVENEVPENTFEPSEMFIKMMEQMAKKGGGGGDEGGEGGGDDEGDDDDHAGHGH